MIFRPFEIETSITKRGLAIWPELFKRWIVIYSDISFFYSVDKTTSRPNAFPVGRDILSG